MKKLLRKDKKNRSFLWSDEIKRFILKNIIKNRSFSIEVRWKALLKLSETLKISSSIFFCNRSVFTGRRKRINKFYSFSRIMLLKFIRFGSINGLRKASW
jgi:small subunit ribosomal protein S14